MCQACHVAKTNPDSPAYTADCRGCEIRALSMAPRHQRAMAIEKYPPEQRQGIEDEARAEYSRRVAVRKSLMGA